MALEPVVSKTIFHDYHVAAGGKMVPFAGYLMPVQYSEGIMQEHLHCRDNAGLFDVSHMGQVIVKGELWRLENRVQFWVPPAQVKPHC